MFVVEILLTKKYLLSPIAIISCVNLPAKLPVIAASNVETWNKRSASVTCTSVAKGSSCILARDSDIRTMASSCLKILKNEELSLYPN